MERQHIKKMLEENVRSSDSIKYSRFIGFWSRDSVCTVTYHVAERERREERQAGRKRVFKKGVDSLILGDSMETLRSILDYSTWFNQKPKS